MANFQKVKSPKMSTSVLDIYCLSWFFGSWPFLLVSFRRVMNKVDLDLEDERSFGGLVGAKSKVLFKLFSTKQSSNFFWKIPFYQLF